MQETLSANGGSDPNYEEERDQTTNPDPAQESEVGTVKHADIRPSSSPNSASPACKTPPVLVELHSLELLWFLTLALPWLSTSC